MLVETFRVNLGSAVLETAFDNSEASFLELVDVLSFLLQLVSGSFFLFDVFSFSSLSNDFRFTVSVLTELISTNLIKKSNV